MHRLDKTLISGLLSIFICFLNACSHQKLPSFTVVERGLTARYQESGQLQHDLSAVAYVKTSPTEVKVFFGFDGGKKPRNAYIKKTRLSELEKSAKKISLPHIVSDIESGTQIDNSLYFLSSLSKPRQSDECELVSFETAKGEILPASFKCTEVRELLLSFLSKKLDASWFGRIKNLPAKQGGLNVEGLSSINHEKYNMIIGLRSPLWAVDFANRDNKDALKVGQAILIFANITDDEIQLKEMRLLDLKGQGIRGMEYVASLNGLILISGKVTKGDDYQLWFYELAEGSLSQIRIGDWDSLCRPESILDLSDRSELLIFSEHSGVACEKQTNNFLRLKYTQ